jgi:predicted class III extradiol MEMO1 family dioxygenase
MHEHIRQPAVAGLFYPADPGELQGMLDTYLGAAVPPEEETPPKALIAPHAGYIYSGPVAASAYARVRLMDAAHAREHSLEVHLPFLQRLLGQFELIPLVAGDASAAEVAEVLERLWGGEETLIVISSDLSHYHDYVTAQGMDRHTSRAIEALAPDEIAYDDACGRIPVNGLLTVARRHGLHAETVDLRNSGDTAGPRDQVVGYGAYVFH